jgi:hypothetical protein
VGIFTADFRVADVIRTDITVITDQGGSGNAPSPGAFIHQRAGIAIITTFRIGSEGTPGLRMAGIVGADIAVVTGQRSGRKTLALAALVTGGANIIVITGGVVDNEEAAIQGITRVIGTNVAVTACFGLSSETLPSSTMVINSAGVLVVTLSLVGTVDTDAYFIAGIVSARIFIITIDRSSRRAETINANIGEGAGITIITIGDDDAVDTSAPGYTDIFSAGIIIIATKFPGYYTQARVTVVSDCTGVSVVTRTRICRIQTSRLGVAHIVRAGVVIITFKLFYSGTYSLLAEIPGRANVQVVTDRGVVGEGATCLGMTTVIGTDIVVRTGQRNTGDTFAGCALVTDCTGIEIITCKSFVGGDR